MFFLSIHFGECLTGNPIKIKLVPNLLLKECEKFRYTFDTIDDLVEIKQDYNSIAGLLFSMGKMVSFMETILTDKRRNLKEFFKGDLAHLGEF